MNLPIPWRNRGRHRAADQIPLLEAERDRLAARNAYLQDARGHADALLVRLCRRGETVRQQHDELQARYDTLAEAHELLQTQHHELAARHIELRADLANLRAVSSPAPADGKPAIRLVDYDTTVPIPVSALWDALGNPPQAAA